MIKLPVAMYRNFSKIVLIFLFTITTQLLSAQVQLLDSLTLDTLTGFTDLNEALKNPDAVTKLVLRKQHLKSFPKEILKFKGGKETFETLNNRIFSVWDNGNEKIYFEDSWNYKYN